MNKFYACMIAVLVIAIKMNGAEPNPMLQGGSMKKKILILTSFAGGNKHAAQAMEEYLKPHYEVKLCQAFIEILHPIDPVYSMTFGKYSGEQLYNQFVAGGHFDFLGWIYGVGKDYIQSSKKAVTHDLLRKYFVEHDPDLIISVIPVINNIVFDVAQELNKPFILAPTDLDVEPYIAGITNPAYEKFYLCSIFKDEDITKPIEKANIPLHIIGAPLKSSFFTAKPDPKNPLKLQDLKLYNYDAAKPTIMVLMGSGGLDDIKKYAVQLLLLKKSCNLIICVGNNEDSKVELNKLKSTVPPHIKMEIIGWTEKIADYMALSDLLITKSGTMSVCEALYMKLPLFLDATSTVLPWEKFNHYFVQKHRFGQSISKYEQVASLIDSILEQTILLDEYRKNMESLEKKDFAKEFLGLVGQILR